MSLQRDIKLYFMSKVFTLETIYGSSHIFFVSIFTSVINSSSFISSLLTSFVSKNRFTGYLFYE